MRNVSLGPEPPQRPGPGEFKNLHVDQALIVNTPLNNKLTAVEHELYRAGLLCQFPAEVDGPLSGHIPRDNVILGTTGYVDGVVQSILAPALVNVDQIRQCVRIHLQ